jgi:ABC-type Zn uptake system ZnuABC Zn-binding protein ZnuA
MRNAPLLLAALGITAAALSGCGSAQPPAIRGVVRVVAGENFWGNIAAQIGGRDVRVTSLPTDPNAHPHLYESDVCDAVAVAEAGLVRDRRRRQHPSISRTNDGACHDPQQTPRSVPLPD